MAESKNHNRYLITSALPYANGPLHIGQVAGAYITADIYARYLRLKGKDVVFVCGSDEHGAAIAALVAHKEGSSGHGGVLAALIRNLKTTKAPIREPSNAAALKLLATAPSARHATRTVLAVPCCPWTAVHARVTLHQSM